MKFWLRCCFPKKKINKNDLKSNEKLIANTVQLYTCLKWFLEPELEIKTINISWKSIRAGLQ